MPLCNIRKVGNKGKLCIWHIAESLDELLKIKGLYGSRNEGALSLSGEEDLAMLNSFSYEHRKKEWLVARILAEQLTEEQDIRIQYDRYNKPSLYNSKKHISISHSHGLLAFILDEIETGIDIERIKPKILNIKEKFMSTKELHAMQKENTLEQLTVHWCAKESLYKLYGKKELAFKEHLAIEPFQYSEKGIIKGWIKNALVNKCYSLQYEKLESGNDSYMLTYVIDQD